MALGGKIRHHVEDSAILFLFSREQALNVVVGQLQLQLQLWCMGFNSVSILHANHPLHIVAITIVAVNVCFLITLLFSSMSSQPVSAFCPSFWLHKA